MSIHAWFNEATYQLFIYKTLHIYSVLVISTYYQDYLSQHEAWTWETDCVWLNHDVGQMSVVRV